MFFKIISYSLNFPVNGHITEELQNGAIKVQMWSTKKTNNWDFKYWSPMTDSGTYFKWQKK